ncbi:MAG TPA: DUF2997 domain-containing protein [Micromonospora sp.]
MTSRPRRIVVTVTPQGTVTAETVGFTDDTCLDYIAVLEELLDAQTVQSAYTAEYASATTEVPQEDREVARAEEWPGAR